ncbi:P-loop containing nucleoside triphosphate hydrolase protein [Panaeolus papilionaceus]|nr:P-loop containing nucleoside triphosphate hydrolase protein [Panaeolus papilionaceus]
MSLPKLGRLELTGDVSIKPVTNLVPDASYRYLIIGPTGAGKSSFIESLAAESQSLSISKDQLAGYTQQVTAYQLMNAQIFGDPVFLIDTPGFSDTKISEIESINMIRTWLNDNSLTFLDHILYLTPINGTRLAGSRRRTIALVREFLRNPLENNGSISFVTTMWDALHSERVQRRAEANFEQLKNDILKV